MKRSIEIEGKLREESKKKRFCEHLCRKALSVRWRKKDFDAKAQVRMKRG